MRSSGCSCLFWLSKAATSKGKNRIIPKVTPANVFRALDFFLERREPEEMLCIQQYLLGTRFDIAQSIS
jgi:hypothetical protein